MAILGCQVSTAGGVSTAVARAEALACDCFQVHIVAPRQWPQTRKFNWDQKSTQQQRRNDPGASAKKEDADECLLFQSALEGSSVAHPLSHASYLINLASPEATLWKKSVEAFIVELQRADALGIPFVVLHPGSFTSGSEELGIAAVIRALDEIHRQTGKILARCLLETTAGQGTNLGWRFEQIATIMDGVKSPDRLGVCFDTCHVFAAGYPLAAEDEYQATMREFDQIVGLDQLQAFHLNDSKHDLGSRKGPPRAYW